jgi:hypothetical protein
MISSGSTRAIHQSGYFLTALVSIQFYRIVPPNQLSGNVSLVMSLLVSSLLLNSSPTAVVVMSLSNLNQSQIDHRSKPTEKLCHMRIVFSFSHNRFEDQIV